MEEFTRMQATMTVCLVSVYCAAIGAAVWQFFVRK